MSSMKPTKHQQLLAHIKRLVATTLSEINQEKYHQAAIIDVLLDNDGRNCRVIVDAPGSLLDELNGRQLFGIQSLFKSKFERRIVPKLTFIPDDGSGTIIDRLVSDM